MTALFDLHYVELVATARLLVDDRETAEDVVMEAFTALHRRWQLLREPGEAHRYLRSCVLNGARSQLRRRKVRRLHEGRQREEPASPQDVAVAGTDHEALSRLMRALPTRQREVLVLRFYLDLSEAEVAEVLGIGKGSVKQHSARGLAALARALEVSR
ncbi:MAG TPA: sigma-70 family RNA polymerase sigma factor [Dermatophilaceae bacterium]|nr:sigma-70 family RNA polymerase sigma factor [Dermatophilaceae bacterium]